MTNTITAHIGEPTNTITADIGELLDATCRLRQLMDANGAPIVAGFREEPKARVRVNDRGADAHQATPSHDRRS